MSVSIENSILKGLMYSEPFARKVQPFLKDEYFDAHYKIIYNLYNDYFTKYHSIPTMEALVISLQKTEVNEQEFETCLEEMAAIQKAKDDVIDVDWLVDEAESYCQQKALYNGLYKSISIIEGSDKELSVTAVPDIMTQALAVAFDSNIGSDYLESFEERIQYYLSDDSRIEFPLGVWNKMSNGGLKTKSLSCILAGTGVGKSAQMCFLAGEWIKEGVDVLYITLELSEEQVQERIDANLLDMSTEDFKKENLDVNLYRKRAEELKKKKLGKLIVKEYPTSQAHAGHFRHLLNELKIKRGFTPKVIFVDYINICSSSRYRGGSGVNSYTIVKSIAEELRGLAVETDTAIITATQTTREGSTASSVDMTATSESFGLPHTLDLFIAITSPKELKERNRQLFILLKSRFGNTSDVRPQMVGVDWAKMRFYDIDDSDYETSQQVERVNESVSAYNKFNNVSEESVKSIVWD